MAAIVVLTGGGIKGAVAAGRYARDHELILVHIDHGQDAAPAESKSLAVLGSFWPGTRLLSIAMGDLDHIPIAAQSSAGTVSARRSDSVAGDEKTASALCVRGLLPIMLSIGARAAMRFGASNVAVGVSAFAPGDSLGLPGAEAGPDARREALHAFNILLDALLRPRTRIRVEAPLMDLDYPEIIKLGRRLQIPFERTWSCDKFGSAPCGDCPTCKLREHAFAEAGTIDPLAAVTSSKKNTSTSPATTAMRS